MQVEEEVEDGVLAEHLILLMVELEDLEAEEQEQELHRVEHQQ